jgi:hypothetical protein
MKYRASVSDIAASSFAAAPDGQACASCRLILREMQKAIGYSRCAGFRIECVDFVLEAVAHGYKKDQAPRK